MRAREAGFDNINMDLIVGLPGEDAEMVKRTLEKVKKLAPESLTVHTLAIKEVRRVFIVISYFVKSLMNTCLKECLRCPGLARYHQFLDGTLSLRCATSRYLMSLKYET